MQPGPKTRAQMLRLGKIWKQGEHILVTGATGSGKTKLTRKILEQRERRGAHIIVFCFKLRSDSTIEEDYLQRGFTRYNRWPKRGFPSWEKNVVIWPDVTKMKGDRQSIIGHQKEVTEDAIAKILDSGHYTVFFDDGLYLVHPQFLGMSGELAMAHAMGRSDKITCVTAAQRPSNLPLIVYGSADHALIGTARERADVERLAALQAEEGSKVLANRIAMQGKHDFLWVPARHGGPAEHVNFKE